MYSVQKSLPVRHLCDWVHIPRSVFYYKSGKGKPGAKPSTHTRMHSGELVSNETVIEDIRKELSKPFADWGYEITAAILRRTYYINEKKVYRLMKENRLLLNTKIKTAGTRNFIEFRSVDALYPMEYLSMDIKYVWVEGDKRNYYQLTIIDIYSKRVLHHIIKPSIRKADVVNFLKSLNERHQIKGVKIRNDNGPQFIAGLVKNFLRTAEVEQQFSRPATPEENCYIEAFHSIMQRAVIERHEFESYYEAKLLIAEFVKTYNEFRPHRSIGWKTPMEMWDYGMSLLSDKPTNEQIDEDYSRPDCESLCEESASYSLEKSEAIDYICFSVSNTDKVKYGKNTNLKYE